MSTQHMELRDLIASTHELAALPGSVVRLLELLDDMTAGADRVLAIIERDPSLTANLLKLCNSAYYGVQRKIGSVREALILLGNKTVVTLAFASGMGDVLRGPLAGYGMAKDDLWRHALATAVGAGYLATRTHAEELRDRAFTAGLVHDIGKLLLNRLLASHLEQMPHGALGPSPAPGLASRDLTVVYTQEELTRAERRLLGYDHCEAGGALAAAWHFPEMLEQAIRHHHNLRVEGDHTDLVRVVGAANFIAKGLGLDSGPMVPLEAGTLDPLTDQGIPEDAIFHLPQKLTGSVNEMLGVFASAR
jgi:HD-like signal output (HDOD) protein